MRITGIAGDLFYKGNSLFMIRNKETGEMEEKYIKRVGMIAAGSGLTPMFQLIQTVADQRDDTSLSLIYSCPSPVSDIFWIHFLNIVWYSARWGSYRIWESGKAFLFSNCLSSWWELVACRWTRI